MELISSSWIHLTLVKGNSRMKLWANISDNLLPSHFMFIRYFFFLQFSLIFIYPSIHPSVNLCICLSIPFFSCLSFLFLSTVVSRFHLSFLFLISNYFNNLSCSNWSSFVLVSFSLWLLLALFTVSICSALHAFYVTFQCFSMLLYVR